MPYMPSHASPSSYMTSAAFLKKAPRRSPLAPDSSVSPKKERLCHAGRWRFVNQPGPRVQITGFEERHGVTEYIIMTKFGTDGPQVFTRHRYTDFLNLHDAVGSGPFPVEKALINTPAVKKARVVRLNKYLTDIVTKCVEEWADKVQRGEVEVSSDVLSPRLQDFLQAKELDQRRLESLRLSAS